MDDAQDKAWGQALGASMQQIINALIQLARNHEYPYNGNKWRLAIQTEFNIRQVDFTKIKTYTQIIDFGHGNNHGAYFSGRRALQIDNFRRLDHMLRAIDFTPPSLPGETKDSPAWYRWLEGTLNSIRQTRETAHDRSAAAAAQRAGSRTETAAFPSPVRLFGRRSTVGALSAAAVSPGARILVLGGPGLGKTTVAVAVGHAPEVAARFGRRRWFVSFEDVTDAEAMRERLAHRVGLASQAPERAVLDSLDSAPGLLILDNFETPWEPRDGREGVERLLGALAALPNLTLLVTMRGHEAPGNLSWTQEHLRPLQRRAARRLFLDEAQTISGQDPHLLEFLTALGGIPLAVRLVALRANGRTSLASLWRDWQDLGVSLAKRLGAAPDKLSSLPISIELSLRSSRLTAAGKTTFSLLGQLPSGLAMADRAVLLAPYSVDGSSELLTLGLAVERDVRLDLLPPIRDYAWRWHAPSEDAMQKWIHHYLRLVIDLGEKIGTHQGHTASGRLQQESANVDAAFTAAPEHTLLDIALAAVPGFVRAAQLTRFGSITTLERLLAVSRKVSPGAETARLLFDIAEVARSRSMTGAATDAYTDSLTLYDQAGDRLGQARCHRGFGDILMGRSRTDQARQQYEHALTLLDSDELDAIDVIARLGRLESEVGHEALGRQHLVKARDMYRAASAQTAEVLGWAHSVFRLAEMDRWRGDFEAARRLYRETEDLCERGGIALGHANARKGLGDIALQEGTLREAIRLFAYARKEYRRLGSTNNEGNAIRGLGDVAAARGSMSRAQGLWRAALRFYERFDDAFNIGTIHVRLARASTGQARLDEASRAEQAWVRVGRDDLVANYLAPLKQRPQASGTTFKQGPF